MVNDESAAARSPSSPRIRARSFSPLFTVGTQIMDLMKWKSPRRDGAGAGALARARPRLSARALPRRPRRRAGDAARRADPRAGARAPAAAPRVLRRPAPAADDRDGAPAAPGPDHRRRADHRARRDDPGADPAPPARAGEGARRLRALHHARSRDRARDLRPRRRDVRGPGDGVGARPTPSSSGPRTRTRGGSSTACRPASGEIRDIPGEVPSLVEPPSGCRFHPRCDYATAECRGGRPDAHARSRATHRVRCYHPAEAPARERARPRAAARGGRPRAALSRSATPSAVAPAGSARWTACRSRCGRARRSASSARAAAASRRSARR